ncbi:IPT/TIG domain-containing protein [Chitinophaga pendula]|uniref:IPT/TIG domain-containing protein n=1 Tax=Chitinophaga TaxID=79328 RepID=UPI000BAF6938|nr:MULTISPECIES: IPT/TIG domain-containing protein [Chitinophaga]ASZ09648.1 hypothetical protein CK934_00985 [Chitinophaga sp. MD30]UCJ07420.1 IPT/TIG domain-containing protein [Chitinophaga pendula]
MKAYNKWLLSFNILMVSMIVLTTSGCKKNDKELQVPVQIKTYYPNSGQAGTLVTIEGEALVPDIRQYKALVGNVEAEVISATDKSVVLRMPAKGETGALALTVHDKKYEIGQYTYQALSITRIFPNNGTIGSQIRIIGTGFSSTKGPAAVTINSKSALIVSATDTLIVAEVPGDASSGAVMVKVNDMEVRGQDFRFQQITSIKPLTGGPNTRITIKGIGFETVATNNVVDINGKTATVVAATDAELVVLAPANVATGALIVSINGQKIQGPEFTVVGKPVITVVSPLSGPQGTLMTISGDIFSTILDENKVFINNVEVPVQSATKTKLTLKLPGGTGSGLVKIAVNDQITEGPQFKDQTLGILAFTPDNGLEGTTVTITGVGFSAVPAENLVYFNGIPATVTAATTTTLEVTAPATLSTGAIKVVVHGAEAIGPIHFRRAGVITLAGGPGSSELSNNLFALAIDSRGNIYVTDKGAKRVKVIAPNGTINTLQINGADVVLANPTGIAIDRNDNIYIGDLGTSQIWKITPSGQKISYVSGFPPGQMTISATGILYSNVETFSGGINKVDINGSYLKLSGPSWPMARPALDADGNLYYSDQFNESNNGLIRLPVVGFARSFVGQPNAGMTDGVGQNAQFNTIKSIVLNKSKELLVADAGNMAIRIVDSNTATVSTLARFTNGYADGTLSNAMFKEIKDIAVGKDGSIYVLDSDNQAVRKIFLQ